MNYRPYNGFNPATKPPTGYELAGKANSALTTWSSNVIIPAHIKLPEGSKLDKEYEITQRGKFYIDGFPSLAAHKVDPDELVKSFKFGEMLEKPLGLLADTTTVCKHSQNLDAWTIHPVLNIFASIVIR